MHTLSHDARPSVVAVSRAEVKNPVRLIVLEARPVVQVIFMLRFAVGIALTSHATAHPALIIAGAISWWLAVVAVYAFNGVMDFQEDVANGSGRPIARGELSREVALAICAISTILAIGLATQIPGLDMWLALYLVLGWWYSAPSHAAKRRSSTAGAVVFGLGWSSYAAGAASTGGGLDARMLVFGLAAAAWMAFVGTLIKDLSDVEGDAASGRRTLAVRYGPRCARQCATLGAVAVGASAVLAAVIYAPTVLVGALTFLVGAACLVAQNTRDGLEGADRVARRGGYRVFMRTQYVANLLVLAASL